MATPPLLITRLRRRVGQLLLDGEGSSHEAWEDGPAVLARHLTYAARVVAGRLAVLRPHLLRALYLEGGASVVAGSLATARVMLDGKTVEPRSFWGALRRPVPGGYVEADGRLAATGSEVLAVTVIRAPVDAGEMPEATWDAMVEEAAASVLLAVGGDTPAAWGRSNDAMTALAE